MTAFSRVAATNQQYTQEMAVPKMKIIQPTVGSAVEVEITGPRCRARISLYDLKGRRIATLWEGSGPISVTLPLPQDSKGVYILTMDSSDFNVVQGIKIQVE